MKNQTMILLVIAGACGLVAMLGVRKYLDKQNQKEDVPKVTVLVAQTPITTNDQLNEMNTQFITVDAANCPEGAVTDLAQIENRGIKMPRGPGDYILVDQLTAPGDIGAVNNIPMGMRLATIDVDANKIHSGMLRPGNRIDVLLTSQVTDQETRHRRKITMPLLQYVEVFAVGAQKFGVDGSTENAKARNISLLVTPDQAMRLETAKGMGGQLSTTLRSSEDKEEYDVAAISEDDLFKVKSEVDERSSLDRRSGLGSENPWLAEANEEKPEDNDSPMMAMLQSAMGGPTTDADTATSGEPTTWAIAIYEGGQVRVEHVDLTTDIPKDTTGRSMSDPAASGMDIPKAVGAGDLPAPADVEKIKDAIDDLEALEAVLQ